MATVAFMKFYISDYLADTQHLSTLEHGAYLLLIMTYFQTGKSLPDNDRKLSQFCKLSVAKFSKVKTVLSEFFFISGGRWIHKRIENELDEMSKKSGKARVSAMVRWEKSHENDTQHDDANAMRTQCERNANAMLIEQNRTEQNRTEKIKANAFMSGKPDITLLKKNSEIKNQAIEILNFLNSKTGRVFRPVDTNLKMISARLKSGATMSQCRQVIAKKTREWKDNEKMVEYLRPATLFNATKFEQYVGEIVPVGEN